MDENGFIKLFRKLLRSPVFKNEKALKVWIWCLLRASWQETDVLIGKQIVHLKEGQFITGRFEAEKELDLKGSTIYSYFKLLSQLSMISLQPNNKFTIITVEKWESYQIKETKNQQQENNRVTTEKQQSNTNKNIKKNIIYFIDKYKAENLIRFNEKMKFLRDIKKDEKYKELTAEDEERLINYVMGRGA